MLLGVVPSASVAQEVRFVDADAPGGDGQSWETAYRDLSDALDEARDNARIDEIWVAMGTYTPDRGAQNRNDAFELVGDVTLYGGFAGNETSREQRDPDTNVTVLSGDFLGDDGPNFTNNGENAIHVLTALDLAQPAGIDGFTIQGGNADFEGPELLGGGGLYVNNAHVVIDGCRFTANSVGQDAPSLGNFGGAIYLKNSGLLAISQCTFDSNRAINGAAVATFVENGGDVTITDCDFVGNRTDHQLGGAVYIARGTHAFARCRFDGNFAQYAGAVFGVLATDIEFIECEFRENESLVQGGAMWLDRCDDNDAEPAVFEACTFVGNESKRAGAILLDETVSHFVNSTFLGNTAIFFNNNTGQFEGDGGALRINFESGHLFANCLFSGNHASVAGGLRISTASLDVVNCTFAGNSSHHNVGGAAILLGSSVIDLANSILWGNRSGPSGGEFAQIAFFSSAGSVNHSIIEGLTGALGGTGNLGDDPRFRNVIGSDMVAGTDDDDARLMDQSPAIDAGDLARLPADLTDLDRDGNFAEPLPLDLDLLPRIREKTVDIGAYEFPHDVLGERATLTDFDIVAGSLLGGDLGDLDASDDAFVRTRSEPGVSAFEPNIMEMIVGAASTVQSPATIDLSVESRINNPSGTARIRFRNWTTGLFEEVHTYPIGTTETVEIVGGIDATNYVRAADGRIELSIRHVVIATFSPLGFDSFFDLVELRVE